MLIQGRSQPFFLFSCCFFCSWNPRRVFINRGNHFASRGVRGGGGVVSHFYKLQSSQVIHDTCFKRLCADLNVFAANTLAVGQGAECYPEFSAKPPKRIPAWRTKPTKENSCKSQLIATLLKLRLRPFPQQPCEFLRCRGSGESGWEVGYILGSWCSVTDAIRQTVRFPERFVLREKKKATVLLQNDKIK